MNGQGCPEGESSCEDKTGNWLKLYRSLEENIVFSDDWLTRLWLWCLMRANFSDKKFLGINVPAGSFLTSMEKAAETLGKSKSVVWRGIQKLEQYEMVSTEVVQLAKKRHTVVTIKNWSAYQEKQAKQASQANMGGTEVERERNDTGTSVECDRNNCGTTAEHTEELKEYKQFQEGEESSATPPPETVGDDIAELEAARLMGSTWDSPEFEKFISLSPRSIVRKRAGIAYQASVPRVLLQLRRDNPNATAKQAHEFLLQKFRQWAESPVGSTPPQPNSPDYRSEVHRWLENEEWNNSPDRLRFGGNMEKATPAKIVGENSDIKAFLAKRRAASDTERV